MSKYLKLAEQFKRINDFKEGCLGADITDRFAYFLDTLEKPEECSLNDCIHKGTQHNICTSKPPEPCKHEAFDSDNKCWRCEKPRGECSKHSIEPLEELSLKEYDDNDEFVARGLARIQGKINELVRAVNLLNDKQR